MKKRNILVISDNEAILSFLLTLISEQPELHNGREFTYACAPWDEALVGKKIKGVTIKSIDVKKDTQKILDSYDLVISAHCKQLFPDRLVREMECVNIHPGFNPHNRGWYPQVFSILNKLPFGATIHLIDNKIDHGDVIDQVAVEIAGWETSLDAYNRVLLAEQKLLRRRLGDILDGAYTTTMPSGEGNVNLRKDFDDLCHIDLDEKVSFGQVIDRLRALTHGSFKNAYFIDKETGKKVYISVDMEVGYE